jgi:hypothetical protein
MEKAYFSSVVNNGKQVIADLVPTLFSAFTRLRGDFPASTPGNVPCQLKSNGCSAVVYGSSSAREDEKCLHSCKVLN